MAFQSGVVSVGTSATLICSPGTRGVMLQNLGAATLYVGGPGVTADTTATGGVTLPATMTSPVKIADPRPLSAFGPDDGLYGRVATGTVNVAFLIET